MHVYGKLWVARQHDCGARLAVSWDTSAPPIHVSLPAGQSRPNDSQKKTTEQERATCSTSGPQPGACSLSLPLPLEGMAGHRTQCLAWGAQLHLSMAGLKSHTGKMFTWGDWGHSGNRSTNPFTEGEAQRKFSGLPK